MRFLMLAAWLVGCSSADDTAETADTGEEQEEPAWCTFTTRHGEVDCDATGSYGDPFVRGMNCRTTQVDFFPREYLVYVPQNTEFSLDDPLPVVYLVHGSGQSGAVAHEKWRWAAKAEEVGLIAVFPTALPAHELDRANCRTKWNTFRLSIQVHLDEPPRLVDPSGNLIQEYPSDAPWPADDIEFMQRILLEVMGGLEVETNQVYASGFSNGGGMTGRMVIEMSELLAAGATSGSGLRIDPEILGPYPTRYISVWNTIGECDRNIAEAMGFPLQNCGDGGTGIPMDPDELMDSEGGSAFLMDQAAVYGMDPDTFTVDEGTGYTTYTWSTPAPGNTDGNVFKSTILAGLGHAYPKQTGADVFWEFFVAQTP